MRDFYWRPSGWRWIVATVEQEDNHWINETVLFTAWRERTAATICGVIFESYLQGQDDARRRLAVSSEQGK